MFVQLDQIIIFFYKDVDIRSIFHNKNNLRKLPLKFLNNNENTDNFLAKKKRTIKFCNNGVGSISSPPQLTIINIQNDTKEEHFHCNSRNGTKNI